MIGVLVAVLAMASASPSVLEINASVFGYNLISPSSRCCPFDLILFSDGQLVITVREDDYERSSRRQLRADQLDSVQQTIARADFFNLPTWVDGMPVDGDTHRMQIRQGSRTHRVDLDVCPTGPEPDHRTGKQRDEVRRACEVWHSIRSLVNDPKVTVQ